jgi:hypothetical protein
MMQTFKIVTGEERVRSDTGFIEASNSNVATRQAAGPLNLRLGTARLDIRRHFFSQRVVTDWNKIPVEIKMATSAEVFKKQYSQFHDRVVLP